MELTKNSISKLFECSDTPLNPGLSPYTWNDFVDLRYEEGAFKEKKNRLIEKIMTSRPLGLGEYRQPGYLSEPAFKIPAGTSAPLGKIEAQKSKGYAEQERSGHSDTPMDTYGQDLSQSMQSLSIFTKPSTRSLSPLLSVSDKPNIFKMRSSSSQQQQTPEAIFQLGTAIGLALKNEENGRSNKNTVNEKKRLDHKAFLPLKTTRKVKNSDNGFLANWINENEFPDISDKQQCKLCFLTFTSQFSLENHQKIIRNWGDDIENDFKISEMPVAKPESRVDRKKSKISRQTSSGQKLRNKIAVINEKVSLTSDVTNSDLTWSPELIKSVKNKKKTNLQKREVESKKKSTQTRLPNKKRQAIKSSIGNIPKKRRTIEDTPMLTTRAKKVPTKPVINMEIKKTAGSPVSIATSSTSSSHTKPKNNQARKKYQVLKKLIPKIPVPETKLEKKNIRAEIKVLYELKLANRVKPPDDFYSFVFVNDGKFMICSVCHHTVETNNAKTKHWTKNHKVHYAIPDAYYPMLKLLPEVRKKIIFNKEEEEEEVTEFTCVICQPPISFIGKAWKGHWTKHMNGARPYKCTQGCERSFTSSREKKFHENDHEKFPIIRASKKMIFVNSLKFTLTNISPWHFLSIWGVWGINLPIEGVNYLYCGESSHLKPADSATIERATANRIFRLLPRDKEEMYRIFDTSKAFSFGIYFTTKAQAIYGKNIIRYLVEAHSVFHDYDSVRMMELSEVNFIISTVKANVNLSSEIMVGFDDRVRTILKCYPLLRKNYLAKLESEESESE